MRAGCSALAAIQDGGHKVLGGSLDDTELLQPVAVPFDLLVQVARRKEAQRVPAIVQRYTPAYFRVGCPLIL